MNKMATKTCVLTVFHRKMAFRGSLAQLKDLKLRRHCFLGLQGGRALFSSASFGKTRSQSSLEDDSDVFADTVVGENRKILKVAIIGEPNSGKSTLVNSLVGEKVFAVTNKPHTTRQGSHAAFCMGSAQVVVLDTPGVVTKSEGRRLKMTREHVTAPENALQRADVICVVSDSGDKRTRNRIHEQVLEALEKHQDIPSLLILNKIDRLRHKTDLLGLTAVLSEDRGKDAWGYVEQGGWGRFEHVFMLSAKQGDGIDDVKNYLAVKAKPGEWLLPPETTNELSLEQRIVEVFREKLLEIYEHEIPWQIKQVGIHDSIHLFQFSAWSPLNVSPGLYQIEHTLQAEVSFSYLE